jgi:hypothetical protein
MFVLVDLTWLDPVAFATWDLTNPALLRDVPAAHGRDRPGLGEGPSLAVWAATTAVWRRRAEPLVGRVTH